MNTILEFIQVNNEVTMQLWIDIFNNDILTQYRSVIDTSLRESINPKETIEDILEGYQKGYNYYLIYKDNVIVGAAYWKQKAIGIAYISGFYIKRCYQRTGIGTIAFMQLIDILHSNGYNKIYWETRVEYIRATAFYTKLGYTNIDSIEKLTSSRLGTLYSTIAPNTILYTT